MNEPKEDLQRAELTDSGELRICGSGRLDGTEVVSEGDREDARVLPAVGNDSAAALKAFDHKIEKITSAVMVVLLFVLNWISVYNGKEPFVPDWAIGVAAYGFGLDWYQFAKNKILRRQ